MPDVRIVERRTPTAHNPIGSKDAGQGGEMTVLAAVAAAVDNAPWPLGARANEAPLTLDRVVRLIRQARPAATG